MPTSSIKKNFVVSGKEQVEKFADAIEASYQESLKRQEKEINVLYHELKEPAEIRAFMENQRKRFQGGMLPKEEYVDNPVLVETLMELKRRIKADLYEASDELAIDMNTLWIAFELIIKELKEEIEFKYFCGEK